MTRQRRELLALFLITLIVMVFLLSVGINALLLRGALAETTMYVDVAPGRVLNARLTPGGEKLYTLRPGDTVVVLEDGEWARVRVAGDEVYVSRQYLSEEEPAYYQVFRDGKWEWRKAE